MKSKLKDLISLILTIAVIFAIVYLYVFVGGWKLFESGDPIKMEIGVSVILGVIVWVLMKLNVQMNSRINELESKIERLEKTMITDNVEGGI